MTKKDSPDIADKADPLSVYLICGFLGAGKTSFLLEMIERMPGRVAVLVNEFGSVGVDGERIRLDGGVEVLELPGGCVCCTQKTNLIDGVREVAEAVTPDLLLVEPSGVAEASGLVSVFADPSLDGLASLEAVFCIIDASTFIEFSENFGAFFIDQIEQADIILLNKIDLVGETEIGEVERQLRVVNPHAPIKRTTHCHAELTVPSHEPKISSGRPGKRVSFETYSTALPESLPRQAIDDLIGELSSDIFGEVVRAKGFARLDGGKSLSLDFVAGRSWLEPVDREVVPRLTVIGLDLDRERIDASLKAQRVERSGVLHE